MPRIIQTTVYTFDELSETAKEKARDWFRTDYPDYSWWGSSYEDFNNIAKILGISIGKTHNKEFDIGFSGFSSQGDGLSFTGIYAYNPKASEEIRAYAPTDLKLQAIADCLMGIHQYTPVKNWGICRSYGHYVHSGCMFLDCLGPDAEEGESDVVVSEETEKSLLIEFQALAQWMYDSLEREYNYLLSNEHVDETILNDDYTFTENGERIGK